MVAAAFSAPRDWTDPSHPKMPAPARHLRLALNASCARHGRRRCARQLSTAERSHHDWTFHDPVVAIARLYASAVFCLQPMGDTVSPARGWDGARRPPASPPAAMGGLARQ